jgi:RNA polymerase sigma-70 factor, ECF subfamily
MARLRLIAPVPGVTTETRGTFVKDADELLAVYSQTVWRVVTRLLGKDDRAIDDCFQDAFVEFYQLSTRRRIQHPRALLVRIATRRAIDVVRRRSVARRRFPRAVDDRDAATHVEPASLVIGDELADALVQALQELPEAQAAVFCMTQIEGMSHPEVAAALGRSPNHVAVLLRRARLRLQTLLSLFADTDGRTAGCVLPRP